MATYKETIKDINNRILGYVETDSITGDKTFRDFYGRILGYYFKKEDITRDFYRRPISRGDTGISLIIMENKK